MLPPKATIKLPITQAVGFVGTHPAASWACLESKLHLVHQQHPLHCLPHHLHPQPLQCVVLLVLLPA